MANFPITVRVLEQAVVDLEDAMADIKKTIAAMKTAGAETIETGGKHYTSTQIPQIVGWAANLEATVRIKLRNFAPVESESKPATKKK